MKKKYNDPDFSGMQIFGLTVPMNEFLVLIINLLLTISPFGLLAKRNRDNGEIDYFATWFMRSISAACCYFWYSLIN